MADDNLSADYLAGREQSQADAYVQMLKGTGEASQQTDAAQTQVNRSAEPGQPKAEDKPAAADRRAPGAIKGAATQVVGGVRDAVVEAGQTIEGLAQWLRDNTPVGALPEGPKMQINIPEVPEAQGVGQGLVRSVSQFLTGFVPFFKATRGMGMAAGAAGATAGAMTDFTVFNPNDPRVSNLINELAPALRNPVTEYLAAKPNDTAAEGRFKNVVEGLGLGGMADGVFRAVKALRAARSLGPEEARTLREALTGEAGAVRGTTEGWAGPAAVKPKALVEIEALPEQAIRDYLRADPSAVSLGDRVLKIGWEQIGNQQALEEVINKTTTAFRSRIETARRGKVSDTAVRDLAQNLGMTPEDFLGRRVGAAMNAEQSLALVNLLGASAKRLRGLADQVGVGNLDARQPMLDQLSLHAAIQEQAFGVRAEAGRALRIWGMDADGTVRHAKKLAEQLDQSATGRGGPLDAERLAHMITTLDSPEQIAKLTREATKPGWTDMAMEVWINGLLSNPATHFANVISNVGTALWAIPERALAARLNSGGQGVVSGEASQMVFGLISGTWDAVKLAGTALREGVPVREGTKLDTYTRKAVSAANLGASGSFGRAIDLLGTGVRLPGRFLMASDEFFKAVNFRMELHAQAARQATTEGLEGKAWGTRVASLVQDTDFLKRVKPIADEFADYQTFTKALGETGQAIASVRDSHPAMKLVLPFLRTPLNIFKYVGERTPLLNRLSHQVRDDLAAGGARADLARARVQLGGMVMASAATLASSGYITGKGPRDPDLRREWLETHQPYSVKIGGKWVSYQRTDPMGMMLGIASDYASIVGELKDVDAVELATASALAISNNMLSKTYLSGLSDVLEAIQEPGSKAKNAINRLAGSLIPAGVAAARRSGVPGLIAADPAIREANSLLEAIANRVPGWSTSVKARHNLWGEPIMLEGGVGPDLISPLYTKSIKPNPASEEMQRLKLDIPMPASVIYGAASKDPLREPRPGDGIPLENDEHVKYIKLAAGHDLAPGLPTLKQAIEGLIKTPDYQKQSDGPDGGKAWAIRKIVHGYRQAAQGKLLADSKDLQDQVQRTVRQKGEALMPPTGLPGSARAIRNKSGGWGLGGTLTR